MTSIENPITPKATKRLPRLLLLPSVAVLVLLIAFGTWWLVDSPRTLNGSSAAIGCVAFSPDGRFLASGGEDGLLSLWDVANGSLNNSFYTYQDKAPIPIVFIAFSPNGKFLLWRDIVNEYSVHVIETQAFQGGSYKFARPYISLPVATSIAFSPDSQTLVSVQDGDTVTLWDTAKMFDKDASGKPLPINCSGCSIRGVFFSPDGQSLIGFEKKTFRVWEIATGKELRRFDVDGDIESATEAADGRVIAYSHVTDNFSQSRTVELLNATTGSVLRSVAFSENLNSNKNGGNVILNLIDTELTFSPDGHLLAANGKTLRVFDVSTGKLVRELARHTKLTTSVAFSPDGRILAAGDLDKTIKLLDVSDLHH